MNGCGNWGKVTLMYPSLFSKEVHHLQIHFRSLSGDAESYENSRQSVIVPVGFGYNGPDPREWDNWVAPRRPGCGKIVMSGFAGQSRNSKSIIISNRCAHCHLDAPSLKAGTLRSDCQGAPRSAKVVFSHLILSLFNCRTHLTIQLSVHSFRMHDLKAKEGFRVIFTPRDWLENVKYEI